MLRKLRIALASLAFAAVLLLFLYPWDGEAARLGFIARWQFWPALLAGNLLIVGVLVLITLLFGRIYCSVLCPLGILQDIVSRLSSLRKGKKMRFTPSKEKKWLRLGVWALFIAAMIAGVQTLVAILEPYSAFGRIIATASGKFITIATAVIAGATLCIVAVLSWKHGRTWCNTICPVGTTLSFFSRFSVFRPVIDSSKCKSCHMCERKCKAACIDISNKNSIDYSRCVDCFDCLDSCKFGALKYKVRDFGNKNVILDESEKSTQSQGRRAFLSAGAMVLGAATLEAQSKKVDGGLAAIEGKKKPERTVPLTPFGSQSVKDFYKKCTACQLCVSVCPNQVLRPSTDLEHLMQPEMSYEKGYCRQECTDCSQICPTGAILPISPAEKTQIHIGKASVNRSLCVVEADGVSCGNCARHCPVGAIMMVPLNPDDPDGLKIPAVDESLCIGCGACEYLCPSRPFSAITVNGLHVHIKD